MEEHGEHHETKTEEKKEKTITLKESTLWKIGVGVLIMLLVAAVWTGGFGFKSEGGSQAQPSGGQQTQPAAAAPDRVKVSVDDDPMLGNKDAKVTVIEFSDFQCPFCRRYWTQTLEQVKKNYIDTNKVRYVFRDYPLSFHPAAMPYAIAAECADEQGKFWEFHDKIFEEQNKQGAATIEYIGADAVKKIAADLGLDAGKFNSCFDSEKYKDEVQKDFAAGTAAGVSGTPGFAIGKTSGNTITAGILSGACPFDAFEKAIEAELSDKHWYQVPNTCQIIVN